VAIRTNVNELLRKVAGYEVRRVPRRAVAAGTADPAKPAKRGTGLPPDYDDAAKATIRAVRPRTMTAPEKLNALILAVRYVVRYRIPGDIVECGVWRGGSMQAVARTLIEAGDTARRLHLYDTFEGMPPPTDRDRRHDGRFAVELLATNARDSGVWAVATLDDVKEAMRETGYPQENIHYHQGRVEETIPAVMPDQVSILRLDTDWYESTRHELEHLYPRLTPGGVLLLDDYGWWEGARQAVDEWLAESGIPLLLLRMASGRIAVKPSVEFTGQHQR
jgi:hypothetical protein